MRTVLLILLILHIHILSQADNYSLFEENGKVGIKDGLGEIIVPSYYDSLGWSEGSFSVINMVTGYFAMGRWGLLNIQNKRITPPLYEKLKLAGRAHIIAIKVIDSSTRKIENLDLHGDMSAPFQYDFISLDENIITIKNNGRMESEFGILDSELGLVILPIYKKIVPLGMEKYAVTNFLDKVAMFDVNGKMITDFVFDKIKPFQHNRAIIECQGLVGMIDGDGTTKIEPLYKSIEWADETHVKVCGLDSWFLINSKNETHFEIEADSLSRIKGGWFRRIVNSRQGLIDSGFKTVWPADYSYIGIMGNNFVVNKYGKYGVMRSNQSQVIPFEYDSMFLEDKFIRALKIVGGTAFWEFFDVTGMKIDTRKYEEIDDYNGSYYPVKHLGRWGGMDSCGREMFDCIYDSIISHKDGLSVVLTDQKYGVITNNGSQKLSPQYFEVEILNHDRYIERHSRFTFLRDFNNKIYYFSNNIIIALENTLLEKLSDGRELEINSQGLLLYPKTLSINDEGKFLESEGLIGTKRNGKYGFVDSKGRLIIANRYENIGEFHEGKTQIKLLSKWGYINKLDQIIVQPSYDRAENFNHGIAIVGRNKKLGVVGQNGEIILPLIYDSIQRTHNNFYILTTNLLKGLADVSGRLVIEPRFEELDVTNSGMVIVSRAGLWGVLSSQGNNLIPIQYQHIQYLKDRDMFLVKRKSKYKLLEIAD